MKPDEIKLRLVTNAENLINTYFGEPTVIDKMVNSTLKVVLRLNIDKVDGFINLFKDDEGEIDVKKVVDTYAENVGTEGIRLDIRDFISDRFICNLLPNKALLIKKEDIMKILD